MEQKIGRILSDFSFTNSVGVGLDWILMLIYRIQSLEKHSPLISDTGTSILDTFDSFPRI